MAVNGVALAAIGAGALFTYAGITGKDIPSALRLLVTGQSPKNAPVTNAISAGSPGAVPAATGSSGSGTTGPVSAPANSSQSAWAVAQLASIGALPTKANIESLISWANHESPWNASPPDGAEYTHNPLNTTYSGGAVGSVNSVGVKVYPDWPTGITATANTLLGGYPDIVARLRAGVGLCGWTSGEFSTWSGGGYSSVC